MCLPFIAPHGPEPWGFIRSNVSFHSRQRAICARSRCHAARSRRRAAHQSVRALEEGARPSNSRLRRFRLDELSILVLDDAEDAGEIIGQVLEGEGAAAAIVGSACARGEEAQQASAAGFQVHATKPVDPFQLVIIVAKLAGARPGS